MNGRFLDHAAFVARSCRVAGLWLAAGAGVLGQSPAARAGAPADPALVCEQVAVTAEQAFGLPSGLLNAIGVVESGRWQPALGRTTPWPYAIDAGGEDFNPETAEAAAAKVAALQADGNRSIDVGCFQVNLLHHPDAFARLDDAFDPARNAAYAAGFLASLKERLGSWEGAVAAYHSGVAMLGEPYRDRVYAVWKGISPLARAAPATDTDGGSRSGVTLGATLGVVLAPSRLKVRVYVPSDLVAQAPAPVVVAESAAAVASEARTEGKVAAPSPVRPVVAPSVIRLSRGRLPAVFTPAGRL